MREHADMVLRLAVAQTGNKADAEDVFQEVFIRLVRSIDKIENEDHLRHWLIRVTINRCKSLFSKAAKKKEVLVERLPEKEEASFADVTDTPATDALQHLPEKYRATLHLFYFEDFSINDIARILEVSEGTIKSQLSRGRVMLRESLEEVLHV